VKYGGNPHLDRMNVAGPLGPYVEVVVRSLLEQALHEPDVSQKRLYDWRCSAGNAVKHSAAHSGESFDRKGLG
jgi:hypothetical protein